MGKRKKMTLEEYNRRKMVMEKSARDEKVMRSLGTFTSMGSHILSDLKGKVADAYTPSNMKRGERPARVKRA